MHCSSGARGIVAIVVLVVLASFARADNIEVKSASVVMRDDAYTVDANIDITLTSTLEDILNKGVALNFLLEFEIIRPRWYWLNEKVATATQQYKLSYNSLTRQYRISIGTLSQNFTTLSDAIRFLSRPRNVPVADKQALQIGSNYAAAIRMRLDVSQLPRPFQITALGSREWNLGSEWYRFAVSP